MPVSSTASLLFILLQTSYWLLLRVTSPFRMQNLHYTSSLSHYRAVLLFSCHYCIVLTVRCCTLWYSGRLHIRVPCPSQLQVSSIFMLLPIQIFTLPSLICLLYRLTFPCCPAVMLVKYALLFPPFITVTPKLSWLNSLHSTKHRHFLVGYWNEKTYIEIIVFINHFSKNFVQ